MRILFTRFPLESALGGAEIQTLSLMEGLIERGHAVSFVGSCPVLLRECRKRNIPVAELDIGKPPVTKFGAISFAWRKRRMKEKLTAMLDVFTKDDAMRHGLWAMGKSADPKAHSAQPIAICMLSLSEKLLLTDEAIKAGAHVFWIEHDKVGRWLSQSPWLSQLLVLSKQATTITVSELSKKIYVDLGWSPEKVRAIPNGIDEKRVARNEPATSNQQLRLGCIARLSPEKGIDVLIEAMKDLPENISLEIIGEGPEEAKLKALARATNRQSPITFSPYEPDISKVFSRIDALILPSRENDPFGMVAAEAMLRSVPVIVTTQCGIADYLEDGKDALVVKAGSSVELQKAIMQLTAHGSRLTIGKNGQKTAQKKFSIKTMVDSYEDVFTRASPISH